MMPGTSVFEFPGVLGRLGLRIGELLYSGRKNCFSLFNLESGFLGQNYGCNILFPGAAPMYLGMTANPMVFPRPRWGARHGCGREGS